MATRRKCAFIDDVVEHSGSDTEEDYDEDDEQEYDDVIEDDNEETATADKDSEHKKRAIKKRIHEDSMDFYRRQLFSDTLDDITSLSEFDESHETAQPKVQVDATDQLSPNSHKRRRRIVVHESDDEKLIDADAVSE